ncbi:hypothetical protein CLIB1423_17S01398 [[Candida] railenensis]|uniref:VPS9 domain-containing protein n=1 Tax=[Candida] railenensis TaxID=45579 RepID=A0A9P0QS61_9ASCO|nr:hypothetical protein CLIB1423_17S01398 [[Candida] railenensis]
MSSNHPVFNISKSTPTTSTSNENTVSGNNTPGPSDVNGGSPLIKNILTRGAPSAKGSNSVETSSSNTPIFAPTNPVAISSVSPTFVTSEFDSGKVEGKPDLIGLFDKFDINKSETKLDDVQSVENALGSDDEEVKNEKGGNGNHGDGTGTEAGSSEKAAENDHDKEKYDEDVEDLEHQRRIDAALGNLEMEDVRDIVQEAESLEEQDNKSEHQEIDQQRTPEQQPDAEQPSEIEQEQESEETDSKKDQSDRSGATDLETPSNEEEFTSLNDEGAKEIPSNDPTDSASTSREPLSSSHNGPEKRERAGVASLPVASTASTSNQGRPVPKRALSKIDPVEQYQQSHKPFDFQNFLVQLKKKSAEPIVRYIRSLLVSFSRQAHTFTYKQKIKIITDFKIFISEKYLLYEPFASMDDIDLENSREGLEKLVMNRLYEFCFPPAIAKLALSNGQKVSRDLVKDDLIQDDAFNQSVEKFSWVNGIHLDVDLDDLHLQKGTNGLNFIEYAVVELNKINNYRAPRDKIICVLNSCKIIFGWLKVSKQETNADSFVPILILVIIKAKTANLVSNMHYIENYRGEEWLSHGETSYYLSSLQGAIGFIQNLSFDDLTISEDEYNAHIEAWEASQKQIAREREREVKSHQDLIDLSESSSASESTRPVSIHQPQPLHASEEGPTSLSPSNVLLNSAGIVSKSIANFLSPSPQPEAQSVSHTPANNNPTVHTSIQNSPGVIQDTPTTREAFDTLLQMFPNIDKAILQDLVYIKHGNIDECVDTCLELVAET